MHSIAHYGLGLGIITSALGALLLCLLVLRYGFTPPDDESPEERSRRQFVTRLGHAAGAVCFALTAGLSAVVLGVSDGRRSQMPTALAVDASPRLRALSTENQRLGDAVHTLGERLTETETILHRLRIASTETETGLPRLRATSSETAAKVDRLERATTTARVAPASGARDARRPATERLDTTPAAPRKSVSGTELRTPALRPAAVSTPPRPVTLPPIDPPPPALSTQPQAIAPDVRPDPPEPAPSPRTATLSEPAASAPRTTPLIEPAPPVHTPVVASPAPTSVAVSARVAESDTIESAARGVTRLGGTLARGVLSVGKSIRRFVEDLQ